ncbi:MAG: type IV pilus assembly protein PilM [Patescibacteria group bacterium]
MLDWINPLTAYRSFRRNLFPSYLGVDIGTTSIKVVEVKPGRKMPAVVNYGFSEESKYLGRPTSAIQSSNLKLFDQEATEILTSIIGKMKPQTRDVIASFPIFSAFVTLLDLPEMTPGELQNSIAFQAKQYIPLPISEVSLEWIKVGEFDDDKGYHHQQILLLSVPLEHIAKFKKVFETAGLNLRWLELESLSVGRILVGNDPTPTAVVDIGSRSTNIAFFEGGQLRFNGQSDFGGASLTQALASSLNINSRRAEELKKERGLVGSGAEYELSTIMLPFLDAILGDVKKQEFNYSSQFTNVKPVERIILSGGGANLLGIEKYVERELGRPTVKASPFLRFEYPPLMEPLIPQLNPLFTVALGLGMKELV